MKMVLLKVLHAIPLYVYIVRENRRLQGLFPVTASVKHWWKQSVFTINDYRRYMLAEHIKELSGYVGSRQRYHHMNHTLEELECYAEDVERKYSKFLFEYNNGMVDENNKAIEFHG